MDSSEKPRREGRRHGIPPAPTPRTEFEVLKADEGALGVALWHSLRNVLSWAGVPPDRRAALFQPMPERARERYAHARLVAPELASALGAFATLQAAPAVVDEQYLADACGQVRDWAEGRGLLAAASLFGEGAAYAQPGAAKWAVDAGRLARRLGGPEMLDRSGAWHRRGFALAVRTRDRDASVRALGGWGAVLKEQGRIDEARTIFERAVRRAVRTGRRRQAALVRHHMFALYGVTGDLEQAIADASEALKLYPLRDERVPYLAADVGYVLLRLGYYRLALRVLERAGASMGQPHEMALMFSATARAAAGARRPGKHQAAARAALDLLGSNEEWAASVLVNLSEAARLLGEWDAAYRYAGQALLMASRRKDREVGALARELVRAARRRVPPIPAEDPPADAPIARLARRIAARLRRPKGS